MTTGVIKGVDQMRVFAPLLLPHMREAMDRSICGYLTLAALWSSAKNPAVLAGLLRAVVARAAEKYPAKTTVAFQTVTRRSLQMVQYLVPDARRISYEYYKRV